MREQPDEHAARLEAAGTVVVGEALVDRVPGRDGDEAAYPGGSPSNVAVGLSRLRAPVSLLTSWGGDPYGRLLRQHVEGNGVPLLAEPVGPRPTSVATATFDERGSASYDFDLTWELPEPLPALPPEATGLHTGSIAAVLQPGADQVLRLVEQAHTAGLTVSYDPNCRPSLFGPVEVARGRVEQLVAAADVVKVSDEDLAWLYPDEPDEEAAARWLGSGPGLVVVTRGADGCLALTGRDRVRRPALPTDMVDTVGAGDAFMSGLLDGLRRAESAPRELSTTDVELVLHRALLVAALATSRAGANPPHVDEVEQQLTT